MSKKQTSIKLAVSFILTATAGGLGSIFTSSAIPSWYAFVNKPSFNPPNWLFGPVWSSLYTMMAVALFLVWRTGYQNPKTRNAMIFFITHLAINALWSAAFFGLHSPLLGLCVIIPLWLMILVSIILFYRVRKAAAWLLVPYLLWVSFATVLNFYIYRLN